MYWQVVVGVASCNCIIGNILTPHSLRLKAIYNQMELKCRCHGVSGSCELKTCWRTLPPFSQVGHVLKQKYEGSVQISLKARKRLRRKGKVKRKVPVRKEDLVHIHKSPNFCIQDPKKGILGTTGRQCNKTSTGPESCNLLCCGRGYNTQVFRQVERCQCRFHWCCFVTCSGRIFINLILAGIANGPASRGVQGGVNLGGQAGQLKTLHRKNSIFYDSKRSM